MRKKSRNFIILLIIIIAVAAVWLIFFRGNKEAVNTNTNQSAQTEDLGKDSLINTDDLSTVDVEPDIDDLDYYIDDLTPPDTTINVSF